MHHKLAWASLISALLSYVLKAMPYLQLTAVLLGITASIASISYHVWKYRRERNAN